MPLNMAAAASTSGSKAQSIWRILWRKLQKEKKKVFCYYSSSPVVHFTYDPYAYACNFDKGSMLNDVDDISRSFSARFAVPSKIFDEHEDGSSTILMV